MKKKLVISLDNASKEVLEAIAKKYPSGWQDYVMKVQMTPDRFFYAITVDTEEISYLIKVPVKIDTKIEEELEKNDLKFLGGGSDGDDGDDNETNDEEIETPTEDMDNIEGK